MRRLPRRCLSPRPLGTLRSRRAFYAVCHGGSAQSLPHLGQATAGDQSRALARNDAIVVAQKAANTTPALTACEYSHCCRKLRQFLGRTVQLAVAELAGWVQRKKMTRFAAIIAAATMASQHVGGSCWVTEASARFATNAAGRKNPTIHQPL